MVDYLTPSTADSDFPIKIGHFTIHGADKRKLIISAPTVVLVNVSVQHLLTYTPALRCTLDGTLINGKKDMSVTEDW